MTVGLIVLLLEGTFVELLETEGTNEMFRMEFAMHSCNASTSDWFLAAVA